MRDYVSPKSTRLPTYILSQAVMFLSWGSSLLEYVTMGGFCRLFHMPSAFWITCVGMPSHIKYKSMDLYIHEYYIPANCATFNP